MLFSKPCESNGLLEVVRQAGIMRFENIDLLFQFCRDNQISYAVRIITFAQDTIDMHVQVIGKLDPADPQLDEKVAQHPLMLQEIRKQKSDLLELTQIKTGAELQEFPEIWDKSRAEQYRPDTPLPMKVTG